MRVKETLMRQQLLLLLIFLFARPGFSWWIYTWPEGKCSSFTTCQDCVVEYAYDNYNLRRPCTWCPGKGTCEMMNEYTGYCSTGSTHRDTCPIKADEMPQCVYYQYSFWIAYRWAPQNRNDCSLDFANDFASKKTDNQIIKICNGNQKYFESVCNSWGCVSALILTKNAYGLEIDMNYDIWTNAGYGEDRRRIETTLAAEDDKSFKWLCQAAHQGATVRQAMLMKYRVTDIDPRTLPPTTDTSSGTIRAQHIGCASPLFIAFMFVLPW